MTVSIEAQIVCVKREIAMRERVYGKWVREGRMTAMKAQEETDAMQAVLQTLVTLRESGGELPL